MLSNGNKAIPRWCGCKKQEYFEKNKDKINEYRRRKYAENKEAKNISLKELSLILIIIMPLSFPAGAPPSSWAPPLLQDGFLAGAIWYTTRRRRCQAPALKRARHPGRGGGTGAAGVPPWGTHGPGGVHPRIFSPWHGRSLVSHPTLDVPFPPRRSGEHRKGTIPARPYATRTNGEWGYSTRRLCWATCAQGRCHPKEALYSPTFTVIY